MTIRPIRPELAFRSLAGSARAILTEAHNVAEIHITDLKGQIDELWQAAGDCIRKPSKAELRLHLERTVEELRCWSAIGLRGALTT